MHPILRYFRRQTGRDLRLRREKGIAAVDSATGGMEESVFMDFVSERKKLCLDSRSEKDFSWRGKEAVFSLIEGHER